ncbi:MAG: hypothetical protein J6I66_05890 [Lachnospiraceae bacterium]|nr:hypothetical protein [Lachnospiraceae bacterium]
MKRLKYLLLIGVLACVTGCRDQSSVAEPVTQETDEPEEVIEEPVEEVIEEIPGESLIDIFKDLEKVELSEQDFSFEYEDHTFSISSVWSDYVDALGYPDEYEQNNYGYISTNSDRTRSMNAYVTE